MKGSNFLLRARQSGSRPGFSSVVVGVVGLVGGGAGAGIGFWVAFNVIGSMFTQDPVGLGETFERIFIAIAVLALGVVFGLAVGSVALSALIMSLLKWEKNLLTVSLILLVDIAVVPLSLVLAVFFADTSEIAVLVGWALAAVAVGGLVPASARWLAIRRANRPATGQQEHLEHAQSPLP